MKLKPEDIRNMTVDELNMKITSFQEELYKLRFEKRTGRVEKPHLIKVAKKNIARCYTILKEKNNASK